MAEPLGVHASEDARLEPQEVVGPDQILRSGGASRDATDGVAAPVAQHDSNPR